MTAHDFMGLPESRQPMQLIQGVLIVSPSPSNDHQRLVARVYDMLKAISSGGEILFAPLDVYLDDETVVEPDVIWRAPDSRSKEIENRLHGAPEFVCEVLSPSTARYDKVQKFRKYEAYGVNEYWIVDPYGTLEVWSLNGEKFERFGVFSADESFESPLFGQMVTCSLIFVEG